MENDYYGNFVRDKEREREREKERECEREVNVKKLLKSKFWKINIDVKKTAKHFQ